MPSHLSFRFLQIMQASRLGLGTLELPRAGSGPDPWSARVSAPGSDTIMVSDGEFDDDDDDMLFSAARGRACQHSGRGENGRWLPVDSGQRSVSDRCRGRIINSLPGLYSDTDRLGFVGFSTRFRRGCAEAMMWRGQDEQRGSSRKK